MEDTPTYEPEEPRLRWSENPNGCPICPEEDTIPYKVKDLIATPLPKLERMISHFPD